MKKIKYLHSLNKRNTNKRNHIDQHENVKTEYLKTLKSQTINSFYQIQKEIFNKSQLNLTFKPEQSHHNRYRRRSEDKSMFNKTYATLSSPVKTKNSSQNTLLDKTSLSVKQLIKLKTYSQMKESQKLKNPFYKIQKSRQSIFNEGKSNIKVKQTSFDKQKTNLKSIKNNKQKLYKTQAQNIIEKPRQFIKIQRVENDVNNVKKSLDSNQTCKNQQKSIFISKKQKQWYLAAKKFRLRTTMRPDQLNKSIESSKIKQNQKSNHKIKSDKSSQSLLKQNVQSIQRHKKRHRKTITSIDQLPQHQVIQFQKSQRILPQRIQSNDIIIQKSQQQSPVKIRQRSSTIKYHEIKDYFQKKYQQKYDISQYLIQNNKDD